MAFSLVTAIVSYRNRKMIGAISLCALSSVLAVWSMFQALHFSRVLALPPVALASMTYLGSTLAVTAVFVFSLEYSHRSHWLSRRTLILLAIYPVMTQILLWAESTRAVFFVQGDLQKDLLDPTSGIWSGFQNAYLLGFELGSILILLDTFAKKARSFFLDSGVVLFGPFVAFLLQLLLSTNLLQAEQGTLAVVGYFVSVLGFAYTIYRGKALELIPITRDSVVEGMGDGWMVLDTQNKIIDINPSAESMVGLTRSEVYGKPVNLVLPDWMKMDHAMGQTRELDMRRTIATNNDWRYLNIRLSNLKDQNKELFGRLLVWRDITDRRRSDDARQRARDEMFVILNAISNAASHATNVEEFLTEAIYQVIYPFQSQIVAICLVDEANRDRGAINLYLAAEFGLTSETAHSVSEIAVDPALFEWVVGQKRPFLVDELPHEVRIRFSVRGLGISNFLIIPLSVRAGQENKIIGCLALARKEQALYTPDEIVRISAICDQIAALIDSDRRRQVVISQLERQRLMRDLHDSVTQKLYGLVTMTEAAQAAIEAGSSVVPSQVLVKIGENARLAVKEMRLFLYEMQPLDLEKEGLVPALHHRIAAVEGRADIKARLLADENITLTKDKEIALYFIAQEALNNNLKHGHAKSVSVILRQTKQNVILEVVDNGRGFDTTKVDGGGLGLQNMKERAAQVKGQFKVTSTPGSGTKVKVTVSRERNPTLKKSRRKK